MSLTVTTDVFCDGDACVAWIGGVTGNVKEAQAARAEAKSYGWIRRKVAGAWVDLCPECAEGG